MSSLSKQELAKYIDHTLLKPQARKEDIVKLCEEAKEHGFYSVCVNGMWVPLCQELLQGTTVKISAVCGFPLGAMTSAMKAQEAAQAAKDGASEIDMVLSVGSLLDGDEAMVLEDIRGVVQAVEGEAIVKVIFETGLLSEEQIALACRWSEQAGAHYVKTSTGFGPGGATIEHIRLMRASVSDHIGVKASGGVRDTAAALAMIEAGATRLGTSSGTAIVGGAPAQGAGY